MKKILFILFCIFNFLSFAQAPPKQMPIPVEGKVDGAGSDGFGTPASPIDMYIYLLVVIAVVMIAVFAKKTKQTV